MPAAYSSLVHAPRYVIHHGVEHGPVGYYAPNVSAPRVLSGERYPRKRRHPSLAGAPVLTASSVAILTPSAASIVARLSVATGQIILTPATVRRFPVSASDSFVLTGLARGGFDRVVSAHSSFTIAAAPEKLSLGSRFVAASSQVIVHPASSEVFSHGILAGSHSTIIVTPAPVERMPIPIDVLASGSIILHPEVSSGVASHPHALDRITLDFGGTPGWIPEGPTVRPLAASNRIMLRPDCAAYPVLSGFEELGRFRRGDRVSLGTILPGVPDSAPVAVVFGPMGRLSGAYELSLVPDPEDQFDPLQRKATSFTRSILVTLEFPYGSYRVSFQYRIGGIPGRSEGAGFEVVPGGDSGGEVISVFSLDRPEAMFVLAQLGAGRVALGRNPGVGREEDDDVDW